MDTFKIGDAVVIWRRNGDAIYDGNIQYVRDVPVEIDGSNRYGLSDANEGEPRGYVESEVLLSAADFQKLVVSGEVERLWAGDEEKLQDVLKLHASQPATASEDTAPTGAGVDYQTMWFSAAKQLAELRVDYDELFKELEEAPPQSLVDEQQTELTSLRAQVATLNAAIADYVDGCDGVGGSYEQARKSFDVLYEIRNRE